MSKQHCFVRIEDKHLESRVAECVEEEEEEEEKEEGPKSQ